MKNKKMHYIRDLLVVGGVIFGGRALGMIDNKLALLCSAIGFIFISLSHYLGNRKP
jgi:hypothetical protein